ncbi:MAG: hypothetical protein P4L46_12925 [Fimbriimonas sp.]|nr:hypothetical protein [Fimbriimonas sp.]
MPLFKRVKTSSRFSSSPSLAGLVVEIRSEGDPTDLDTKLPVQGEIIESFEIADTPGGWHLVWLDEAIESDGETHAHLMIAPRWVARPLTAVQEIPVNVRYVPDVTLVQKGAPDIEKLPFASKANAILV